MNNDGFDETPRRANIFTHTGFRMGALGILLMALVRGFFLLLYPEKVDGNLLTWLIQWVLYLILARVAAERHYDSQQRSLESLRGVSGAGVGAALTTSVGVWALIILTALVMDANGVQIVMKPFSVCAWIILDVLLALGFGSWSGGRVTKKYQNFSGWQ
ncbi:MAG: hypothetical protein OHK0031_01090 [Anaerolineales bacterium]